eukprot:2511766-Rhodomonas_salina.2
MCDLGEDTDGRVWGEDLDFALNSHDLALLLDKLLLDALLLLERRLDLHLQPGVARAVLRGQHCRMRVPRSAQRRVALRVEHTRCCADR